MNSLNRLYDFSMDELRRKHNIGSFQTLNENWDNNLNIKNSLEFKEIMKEFKIDFKMALDCLFAEDIPYYHKQLIVQHMFEPGFSFPQGYILALYTGNTDNYRDVPKLFKDLIKKFDMEEYKEKTTEEIKEKLEEFCKITKPNVNGNRTGFDLSFNTRQNIELYKQFEENGECPNWLVGEYNAYQLELEHAKNTDSILWVPFYFGDGFGYDILSHNNQNGREELIEVKTGESDVPELTLNEYLTMINANEQNADYFIYKYSADGKKLQSAFYYNYERDELLDFCDDFKEYYIWPMTRQKNDYNHTVETTFSIIKVPEERIKESKEATKKALQKALYNRLPY